MRNIFDKCWILCLLFINILAMVTGQGMTAGTTPITTQASNTSAIYIVTSFIDSTATTELTTHTFQTTEITSMSSTTYAPTSSVTSGTFVHPTPCDNATYVTLANGTCVSREDLITSALNTLNSNTTNDTQKANALSTYITAITGSNLTTNASNSLTIGQIDGILGNFSSSDYTVNTSNSIIVITKPKCNAETTIIGAAFESNQNAAVIDTQNFGGVTNSLISAAGVVNFTGLCTVNQFNTLIISNPTTYRTADNTTNSTLVSSIVMATLNTTDSVRVNVNVQLYFQDLRENQPSENGTYLCSFYDTRILQWNQSGCSIPVFNSQLNRYECSCNHLTSFAMIWLPQSTQPSSNGLPPSYDAQDKASIAFQVISIICFIGILIHAITVRIIHPKDYTQIRHLLPIISCGITMILFIFYIALGLTVFTGRSQSFNNTSTTTPNGQQQPPGKYIDSGLNSRADFSASNSSSTYTPCTSTEHGLMFTVYFLIILMFCSKTSIGIDNYRRYVDVFNVPSYRMLSIAMGISVLISGIWLAFAAGFASKPSNQITQVYDNKLCWFNRTVNQYFLTIPVCIFLAINLALYVPVVKHSWDHVGSADEKRDYFIRRRHCMYVLLVSASTQGFGWLLGPVISIASPSAGYVLGWFFIILNGLEGLWAILIYCIVKKEGLNTSRRGQDYWAQRKNDGNDDDEEDDLRRDSPLDNFDRVRQPDPLRNVRSESPRHSFADLPGIQLTDWPSNNK